MGALERKGKKFEINDEEAIPRRRIFDGARISMLVVAACKQIPYCQDLTFP
jgi:hypothetical protein